LRAPAVVPRLVTPRTVRASRRRTAVAGVATAAAEEHHDGGTATGAALARVGGTLTKGRAGYRVHRVLTLLAGVGGSRPRFGVDAPAGAAFVGLRLSAAHTS
jgi:hypothetical protein